MSETPEKNINRLERAKHHIHLAASYILVFVAAGFLVVGIIAAIWRMLIITAESAGHVNLTDPVFQALLAEPGLLALIIFLLAWSMRLPGDRSRSSE